MFREKKKHENSMEWQYIFILLTKLTFDMVLWFFFFFRSFSFSLSWFFFSSIVQHTPYKLLLFAFSLSALSYCYLFPINFRLILFRTQSIRLRENKQHHSFFFLTPFLIVLSERQTQLYSPFIFWFCVLSFYHDAIQTHLLH